MSRQVVYGYNAVMEALATGAAVESVHLAVGLREATRRDVEEAARARGVPVMRADRRELDHLAEGGVHQGVLAFWGQPRAVDLADLAQDTPGRRCLVVCLDEVQDPHNLGALARSALAFGAAGLVLPERRSAGVTPAAVKASAGALCRLPVARVTNLGQGLEQLRKLGFWLAGAVLDGDQAPWELDPGERVALVLGSEGGGLRPSIAQRLDFRVKIPMLPGMESLNVSVAGALLMYEWLSRPRRGR
ncbi:MAG TPA: 23S rRNA (guanosine(2251)-2'-O)-methyltransferase RlmB [Myxococcota bacterium]|nr:23S rRNA (guanosine(2251)-2'-O)-methyltransferase RlmB [Myxococcota bacterium]HRY94413.1 23S rRNA (guanosine(2251)-2'-O)-methyltransferase RlmB [Myxococcota bacterium]